MFEAKASRANNVPAASAWSLLSDWGNAGWLPGPERIETVREGDRVTRRLFMKDAEQPIEETMLSADPQSMTIQYTIAPGELFPLKNYQGKIVVAGTGEGCRVDWSCAFDPGQMSREQARTVADGNLQFLLDSLAGHLEA